VKESNTHKTPELSLSLSAPNRLAARSASIASFVALAVAGYLRFDIGHPGAGRLLAVCSAVTIVALIVRFSRAAQEHYQIQPWIYRSILAEFASTRKRRLRGPQL
jgi:hypothetical protein